MSTSTEAIPAKKTHSINDFSNSLTLTRDIPLNQKENVSWYGRKICAVASTIARHQTTLLVSGVAIIALGSVTGFFPQEYAITMFKQSMFQLAVTGLSYGLFKINEAFIPKKVLKEQLTKFETTVIKPMSEEKMYKTEPKMVDLSPLEICLYLPIGEELIFRGALYALSRRIFSLSMQSSTANSAAVITSSILFSAAHMPQVNGLSAKITTAVGPFLNSYYFLFPAYFSGGFPNAILAHVVHNLQSSLTEKHFLEMIQNSQENSSQEDQNAIISQKP